MEPDFEGRIEGSVLKKVLNERCRKFLALLN